MSGEPAPPGPSGARRRWLAAGLVLGSLTVALGIGELVCRPLVPSSTYPDLFQDSDDPLLGYELRPGADLPFDGITIRIPETRVRISSRGFRSEETTPDPQKRRLVCLGDSVTFGWGVEEPDSFCARVARTLGGDWQHFNLGVPGYNTAQELRQFERRGLPLRPELVVLQIDPNDVMEPDTQASSDSVWAWLVDHSALARFVHIRLRAAGGPEPEAEGAGSAPPSPVPLSGIEGVVGGVERLHVLSREHGFRLMVLFTPGQDDGPLRDVLTRRAVPTVDLRAALFGPPERLEIPGDGHPTAEGHRLIAAAVVAAIAAK